LTQTAVTEEECAIQRLPFIHPNRKEHSQAHKTCHYCDNCKHDHINLDSVSMNGRGIGLLFVWEWHHWLSALMSDWSKI